MPKVVSKKSDVFPLYVQNRPGTQYLVPSDMVGALDPLGLSDLRYHVSVLEGLPQPKIKIHLVFIGLDFNLRRTVPKIKIVDTGHAIIAQERNLIFNLDHAIFKDGWVLAIRYIAKEKKGLVFQKRTSVILETYDLIPLDLVEDIVINNYFLPKAIVQELVDEFKSCSEIPLYIV